jgi:hypothetical protein
MTDTDLESARMEIGWSLPASATFERRQRGQLDDQKKPPILL